MKERPILFSGPMVRAILEGTKTQTRRVVQPQPAQQLYQISDSIEFAPRSARDADAPDWARCQTCPYGAPGDRLWVRETWQVDEAGPLQSRTLTGHVRYASDDRVRFCGIPKGAISPGTMLAPGRWRPSIHMPRWASRIDLEITGVRVERLQDISEADMCAEGLDRAPYGDPSAGFQVLWDMINAKRGYSWASNPWVWALEFQRV